MLYKACTELKPTVFLNIIEKLPPDNIIFVNNKVSSWKSASIDLYNYTKRSGPKRFLDIKFVDPMYDTNLSTSATATSGGFRQKLWALDKD